MKTKIITLLFSVLLLSSIFVGCVEEKEPNKETSVEQIMANLADAFSNTSYYKYMNNCSFTTTVFNESKKVYHNEYSVHQNASFDLLDRNLKFEQYVVGNDTTSLFPLTMEYYILNDTIYEAKMNDSNLSWEHRGIDTSSIEYWHDGLSRLEDVCIRTPGLFDDLNLSYSKLDDEIVDGKTCYVLYIEYIQNYTNTTNSVNHLQVARYKYWIEKNNFLLYKYQEKITQDFNEHYSVGSYALELYEGDTYHRTVYRNYTFYDYNIPITIELPPEALQNSESSYKDDLEYIAALAGTDYPIAALETSKGTIAVELYDDKAPETCANFIKLVNDGFYDGMIFHRILDDFMIQAGNTYPDGSTKTSDYGIISTFEGDLSHVDGAISMASTGAATPGETQFFICDGAQTFLDGSYAAFGKTIYGIEVVRDIADDPHDSRYEPSPGGGKPNTDIIINSIKIVKE